MRYLSVAKTAKKWGLSERTVRSYCAQGRIPDAFLTGKTWNIPENAEKPSRIPKAKKEPDKHRDLIVRVCGLSVYFVNLPEHFKDDMINRNYYAY